jgi:DMSO/TMAO reductase YedYZ molybdopterin-dependent catalytic subunit
MTQTTSGRYLHTRRAMLRQTALAGLTLAAAPLPSWALGLMQAGETIIPFTDIPANFSTRMVQGPEENPGQNMFRQDLRELRAWRTPVADFFAVGHYNVPRVDRAAWQLSTRGVVSSPIRFTLDEIHRRPRVERTVTFECSGNQAQFHHGMVGNATFGGCSLRALLEETRIGPSAKEVIFWGADSGEETIRGEKYPQFFARSLSLEDALGADAILAWEMNGEPLTVAHGFPLRLIVPGFYGIAQVKWLTSIELSETRLMTRFMARDYVTVMGRQVGDRVEWIETSVLRQRVKSVVARVSSLAGSNRTKVFGAAWSDGTPIRTVELRIDGGGWEPARLEPQPEKNPFAWTFFTHEGPPLSAGEHTLVSRATDEQGRVQPEKLDLKKTYWEDNAQFIRRVKAG